jgi:hypothetical protein
MFCKLMDTNFCIASVLQNLVWNNCILMLQLLAIQIAQINQY